MMKRTIIMSRKIVYCPLMSCAFGIVGSDSEPSSLEVFEYFGYIVGREKEIIEELCCLADVSIDIKEYHFTFDVDSEKYVLIISDGEEEHKMPFTRDYIERMIEMNEDNIYSKPNRQ